MGMPTECEETLNSLSKPGCMLFCVLIGHGSGTGRAWVGLGRAWGWVGHGSGMGRAGSGGCRAWVGHGSGMGRAGSGLALWPPPWWFLLNLDVFGRRD